MFIIIKRIFTQHFREPGDCVSPRGSSGGLGGVSGWAGRLGGWVGEGVGVGYWVGDIWSELQSTIR